MDQTERELSAALAGALRGLLAYVDARTDANTEDDDVRAMEDVGATLHEVSPGGQRRLREMWGDDFSEMLGLEQPHQELDGTRWVLMAEQFTKHWLRYEITSSEGYSIAIVARGRLVYADEVGRVELSFEPPTRRGVDVRLQAREVLDLTDREPQVVIDRFRRAFAAAGWRLHGFDDASMWLAARPPSTPPDVSPL